MVHLLAYIEVRGLIECWRSTLIFLNSLPKLCSLGSSDFPTEEKWNTRDVTLISAGSSRFLDGYPYFIWLIGVFLLALGGLWPGGQDTYARSPHAAFLTNIWGSIVWSYNSLGAYNVLILQSTSGRSSSVLACVENVYSFASWAFYNTL